MRINTTIVIGTAALALATATLGACGSTTGSGGSAASGAYCKELKTDKAYFQALDSDNPDLTKLDVVFQRMHSLAASAPAAAAADWKTLDGAITTVEKALDDAGLNFADLAAMQDGDIPDDVDLDAVAALGPKMEALGGTKFIAAADDIDKHAQHTCGFALASS